MASIKVIIYDPTGSKKTPVELPNDVPMRRLIPALVSKMGLPTSQGANPITYRLDHRASGKRLAEDDSLSDAGVSEDDILSLFPEVTARLTSAAIIRCASKVAGPQGEALTLRTAYYVRHTMSFDIRETRLRNDYQRIRDLVNRSELIHILNTDGDPPEKYHIQFTCRGVEKLAPAGQPVYRSIHEVSIYLHAEYPMKQPQLKWLTPIFHPNIHTTGAVCIGAWWPAKTLDELLLTLGEMVQYKNLGPKDPMNSKAAAWALRNKGLFPIDNRPLKGQSLADLIVIGMEEESDDFGINIL